MPKVKKIIIRTTISLFFIKQRIISLKIKMMENNERLRSLYDIFS